MAPPARYDHAAIDAVYTLPKAGELAGGSIVLGTTGTERTALRWGFILWSVGLVIGGMTLGYALGRKSHA